MNVVDGWEPRKLTELAEYINGYAFKPEDWGEEGLPIIRIEQLKNPTAPTDYYSGRLPAAQIINDGDLLFSWSASLFLKIWNNGQAALNQHLFKVIERQAVDRLFLKAFIEFYLPELIKASHGSTMQHITRKELDRFNALFPISKTEQTKIADILSTVDRAIEQTEALIAKQQRIKAGLMQDLLTRGIDEHGNLRSEETHQFKDSPLGRIPTEWSHEPIGCHLQTIEQGWSPDCESISAAFGQWGVLKTTSVVWDGFNYHENKLLPSHLEPRKRYEVRVGDVLMTRAGPNSRVGVVAYVYETQPKLMLSDKLYRLNPDESIDAEFLVLSLSSDRAQRYLSTLKTGLAESQTNISQDIVRQLKISLPSINEQIQIAKIVHNAMVRLNSDMQCLAKMGFLKTALMQDLLPGKRRVTALLAKPEEASA